MKNNRTVLLTGLVIVTLVFLAGVIVVTMKQPNVFNQASQPPVTSAPSMAPVGPVSLIMNPQGGATVGKTFTVDLVYNGLTKPIIASDILLKYDPTVIDFVDVQNVDSQYMNPRKLFENNTLILSFIRKPGTATTAASGSLTMGQLVLRARKSATASLSPVLTTGSRTSLVFVEGNQVNQLGTGNAVDVVIK